MKRLFSVLLIIALLLSFSCSFASSSLWKFSTYGESSETKGLFSGDTFSLDLYMSVEDLTAFIQLTIIDGNEIINSTKFAKIKSKDSTPGVLYFVFADDSYYTAHYDEKGTYLLWLDIDGYSIRLDSSDEFVAGFSLKGN